MEANRRRKESKKIHKIKFRQEVDVVKRNIEKRDEIWKQQQLADISKHHYFQQQMLKQQKGKDVGQRVSSQLKTLKQQDKLIKKLSTVESQLIKRLETTIELEKNSQYQLQV